MSNKIVAKALVESTSGIIKVSIAALESKLKDMGVQWNKRVDTMGSVVFMLNGSPIAIFMKGLDELRVTGEVHKKLVG